MKNTVRQFFFFFSTTGAERDGVQPLPFVLICIFGSVSFCHTSTVDFLHTLSLLGFFSPLSSAEEIGSATEFFFLQQSFFIFFNTMFRPAVACKVSDNVCEKKLVLWRLLFLYISTFWSRSASVRLRNDRFYLKLDVCSYLLKE